MDYEFSSKLLAKRNAYLNSIQESTFDDALILIQTLINKERTKLNKLALFLAKAWILKNKLHSALNDTSVSTLNEVPGSSSIFCVDVDEASMNIDKLFD